MMRVKLLVFLLECFSGYSVFAKLNDLHYLPALKRVNSAALTSQALYVCSPKTSRFNVKVYLGNNTVALTKLTVSTSKGIQVKQISFINTF
jgi:hypothetical protein